MNKKTALYIGRFQPFHLGHLDAINQIKKKGFERIIIGIGSSQEERTEKNPFSFYERREMINSVLSIEDFDYNFFSIPDFGDDQKWTNYILKNCPRFDTVFSGNPYVENCFNGNKSFEGFEINEVVKATEVRRSLANKTESWKKMVSRQIIPFIESKQSQLEKILRSELKTPYLAVDGIVRIDNKIVLIERKNEPFGYALPGGFVDYGEACENAVRRELKEEIGLEIEDLNLLGVYSNPNRDPRQHVVSIVYSAVSKDIPKAGDDAKRIIMVPINELNEIDLVFDHKKILEDYLRNVNN